MPGGDRAASGAGRARRGSGTGAARSQRLSGMGRRSVRWEGASTNELTFHRCSTYPTMFLHLASPQQTHFTLRLIVMSRSRDAALSMCLAF